MLHRFYLGLHRAFCFIELHRFQSVLGRGLWESQPDHPGQQIPWHSSQGSRSEHVRICPCHSLYQPLKCANRRKKSHSHHGKATFHLFFSICNKFCILFIVMILVSSLQSLSCVWLFATPWTAAHQTSLSITNYWSLLKLMLIELYRRTVQKDLHDPDNPMA